MDNATKLILTDAEMQFIRSAIGCVEQEMTSDEWDRDGEMLIHMKEMFKCNW